MIEIYPDMYHDTISLAVSSRFSCVLCSCGCTRASLVLFGLSNTRVSADVSSQDSLSKVSNVEASQLEGILCHGTAYSWEVRSSLCWCRPGLGTWFFPLLPTRLETRDTGISLVV